MIGEAAQRAMPCKRDSLITSSQFLDHQSVINAVFILARFSPLPPGTVSKTWRKLDEPISGSVPLVPDAYLELLQGPSTHSFFLEVDLGTESSAIWKGKVEQYLKFAKGNEFERLFGHELFRVLVVFRSARRLDVIRRRVAARTPKLFLFATLDELTKQGLCGPVWLHPSGTTKRQLP